MKLAKLSLAAIVAVGTMTSFASATPLEEAIKGVDFSGMMRYRWNDDQDKNNGADTHASSQDFDFLGKFTAPVTEDIKAVLSFASLSDAGVNRTGSSNPTLNVDLRKSFLVYSKNGLTVRTGMQDLLTPVTDNGFNGNKGTGVAAMYTMDNVTFAGVYFGGANLNKVNYNYPAAVEALADEAEVAALAVIGSFGPVNARVWGIQIQNVVDAMIFAEVGGKYEGFGLTAQYINTELSDTFGGQDGDFFAVKASAEMAGFSVNAGYSQNDETQGIYSVAGPDSEVIHGGWKLGEIIANKADYETYFINAGYKFDKFGVTVGYADAESDALHEDATETYARLSYSVAKNLSTSVAYSMFEQDNGPAHLTNANGEHEQDYFRFEALYKF